MNFHVKAMLVGATTVILCMAVFLWIVVLDKGTLMISAEAPYSVEIEGETLKIPKNVDCSTNSCSVSVPGGDYSVSLTKEGYYDESRSTSVKRGQTSTLTVEFIFIPTIELSGNYESYIPVFEEEDVSSAFSFEMDTTYDKQRLIYTSPETDEVDIWAYFDRELQDPLVFAHPDLTQVLVVDRAEADQSLYLIDGQDFDRSYLGTLEDVNHVEWSADGSLLLLQSKTSRSGDIVMWVVDTASGELEEWPFELESEKVLWDGSGRLVFVTDQNLGAVEGEQITTTVDVLKGLLTGAFDSEKIAFSVGQYDPELQTYKVLYEATTSLEMNYEDVFLAYDKENEQLYFTDGVVVYEVAW